MFGITDVWLFVFSGLLLNLIPGPDLLYIIGRSASQGGKAGALAALGVGTGTFVHIFAAAFGLSAILAQSATAFSLIKLIGCGYLFYLGFSLLLKNQHSAEKKHKHFKKTSMKKTFSQGFLTNALNPKVALFFLAFVPQFISSDSPNKAIAFLILGVVFNVNSMVIGLITAWATSSLSAKVKLADWGKALLNKLTGILFIGFGMKLLFSK